MHACTDPHTGGASPQGFMGPLPMRRSQRPSRSGPHARLVLVCACARFLCVCSVCAQGGACRTSAACTIKGFTPPRLPLRVFLSFGTVSCWFWRSSFKPRRRRTKHSLCAFLGWGRLRGRAHRNLIAAAQHIVGSPVGPLPGLGAPQRIFPEFHAALKNYTSTQYVRRMDLLRVARKTTEEPCYQFCPATLPSSVQISSVRTPCTDDTSL